MWAIMKKDFLLACSESLQDMIKISDSLTLNFISHKRQLNLAIHSQLYLNPFN